jgi:hypothetical protein
MFCSEILELFILVVNKFQVYTITDELIAADMLVDCG